MVRQKERVQEILETDFIQGDLCKIGLVDQHVVMQKQTSMRQHSRRLLIDGIKRNMINIIQYMSQIAKCCNRKVAFELLLIRLRRSYFICFSEVFSRRHVSLETSAK